MDSFPINIRMWRDDGPPPTPEVGDVVRLVTADETTSTRRTCSSGPTPTTSQTRSRKAVGVEARQVSWAISAAD